MLKPITETNLEDIVEFLEKVLHNPNYGILVRFEVVVPEKITFEVQEAVRYRRYPGKGVVFVFDIGPVESQDPDKLRALYLSVEYVGVDNKHHIHPYTCLGNCDKEDIEDLKKRLKKDIRYHPDDNVNLAIRYF